MDADGQTQRWDGWMDGQAGRQRSRLDYQTRLVQQTRLDQMVVGQKCEKWILITIIAGIIMNYAKSVMNPPKPQKVTSSIIPLYREDTILEGRSSFLTVIELENCRLGFDFDVPVAYGITEERRVFSKGSYIINTGTNMYVQWGGSCRGGIQSRREWVTVS